MKHLTALTLLGTLLLPAVLHAQIITSATEGTAGTSFDYDTTNPTTGVAYPYWAQFGVSGTEAGPALMNVEAGGSTAVTVSPISQTGDPLADGVEATSGIYFQYDNDTTPGQLSNANGTSPQSSATVSSTYPQTPNNPQGAYKGGYSPGEAGQVSVQTGIAGGGGSPASGQALTFTITFNQAVSEGELHLVANNYESSSTVSFTFNNGATESVNGPDDGGTVNELYVLNFSNVAAGSVLTITDTQTGTVNNDQLSNISLAGVAFPTLDVVVPEPSTYAMLLGGVALLLGIMRLRRLTAWTLTE